MSHQIFNERILKLYASHTEMAANIVYIRRELQKLRMADDIRDEIVQMCDNFDSALYDVRKEVRTLEDKLGMHPGEEPFDPGVTNPDPRVTMEFIRNWLWSEIERLHAIVTRLERDSKGAADIGSVYVLVAESAVNILRAFTTLKEALEVITTTLDGPQSG